jgi:hypothetical protein
MDRSGDLFYCSRYQGAALRTRPLLRRRLPHASGRSNEGNTVLSPPWFISPLLRAKSHRKFRVYLGGGIVLLIHYQDTVPPLSVPPQQFSDTNMPSLLKHTSFLLFCIPRGSFKLPSSSVRNVIARSNQLSELAL